MKEDSINDDLTNKSADPELDKLTLILRIVRSIETHGALLVQVIDRLDKFGERFDKLTARIDAVETRLNVIETRLDAIEGRLHVLEQTVRRSVHNLGRGQTVLNDAILKIHISFLDIKERLQGLDPRTSVANSQT